MQKDTILVIGANGTVGTELVRLLKEKGHKVRKATSKAAADSESVHVNLATGEGLSEAFAGIDKAFLLSPPGYGDHFKILHPLIEEAKKRKLNKVVLMSAYGADANEAAPLRRAEVALIQSGLSYNILRPNWFMQNFNTFWLQTIREQNKILLPVGKAKTSFIDARDISAVAAELLTTDKFNNQEIDITGPESLTHDEVAQVISNVTGRKITYEEIGPGVLRNGFVQGGVPEDYADFLLLILGFLKEGYNSPVNENVKKILGRDPKSMRDYAKDYKAQWI